MPTIAERARAEAEAAEADENEEQQTEEHETEHDGEPVVEPEPHPGDGLEEPSDQMIAELRAACDEHHDHVHAIMGPFVEAFQTCETCNGLGIAYPQQAGPTHEHAPGTTTCSVCAGLGELETGSKRQGYELIGCVNCNGQGWVGQGNMPTESAAKQAVETYPAGDGTEQPQQPAPQPQSTDPFEAEAERRGYIVLKKPGA
jgi:hypothetical protein